MIPDQRHISLKLSFLNGLLGSLKIPQSIREVLTRCIRLKALGQSDWQASALARLRILYKL
jgi:hypothetical protein